MKLAAHGGPADVGITLQNGDFESRFGEVGPVGEAVVACTNDDRVVLVLCTLR